jgi:predicted metal-dependent HD superfamily phosphohydrolase
VNVPSSEQWQKLWRHVGAVGNPLPVLDELVALYSQPHRHYHNLCHIAECLAEFDPARHLTNQPDAVELAVWFHDAIYDTHAADNEEQSATLASQRLAAAGVDAQLRDSIAQLILATITHNPSLHPDAALLVDVDLSILGQPEPRFLEYEAQIRREYEWVPQPTFAAKRAEILERFLERNRIFATDLFFAKYEDQARTNLIRSVKRLTPGIMRPAPVDRHAPADHDPNA